MALQKHLRGLRARKSVSDKAEMVKQQRRSLVVGDGGAEERKAREKGAMALCAALKRNQNFTGVVLGQLEMLDASLAHNMRQLVCSDPSSIVGGNGLSTREGAAALEKMCVSLRQKRHALATDMVRRPERQRELDDARYDVSRAEGWG